MSQYSFLFLENFTKYAKHGIKDIYKSSKEKYLGIRNEMLNNKKNNVINFLSKLISIDDLNLAKNMVKYEKLKLNFSKIPKDVLKHIEFILNNSDDFDYVDKLMIYKENEGFDHLDNSKLFYIFAAKCIVVYNYRTLQPVKTVTNINLYSNLNYHLL